MVLICYMIFLSLIYNGGRILETLTVPYYTDFTVTLFLLLLILDKIQYRKDTVPDA